jgi:hypothetical protein
MNSPFENLPLSKVEMNEGQAEKVRDIIHHAVDGNLDTGYLQGLEDKAVQVLRLAEQRLRNFAPSSQSDENLIGYFKAKMIVAIASGADMKEFAPHTSQLLEVIEPATQTIETTVKELSDSLDKHKKEEEERIKAAFHPTCKVMDYTQRESVKGRHYEITSFGTLQSDTGSQEATRGVFISKEGDKLELTIVPTRRLRDTSKEDLIWLTKLFRISSETSGVLAGSFHFVEPPALQQSETGYVILKKGEVVLKD